MEWNSSLLGLNKASRSLIVTHQMTSSSPPEKHEGYGNLYRSLDKDCTYYLGNIYNSKAEAEDVRENKKFKYIATIKIEWEE